MGPFRDHQKFKAAYGGGLRLCPRIVLEFLAAFDFHVQFEY